MSFVGVRSVVGRPEADEGTLVQHDTDYGNRNIDNSKSGIRTMRMVIYALPSFLTSSVVESAAEEEIGHVSPTHRSIGW